LDRVILHTVMHHSSTSTYMPNFGEIEETFCGQTDGRTLSRVDLKYKYQHLVATRSVNFNLTQQHHPDHRCSHNTSADSSVKGQS